MIFYFSGTGNSQHAAKALARRDENIYYIADCIRDGQLHFSPGPEETVGFVCPVYFGDLPLIMRSFLEQVCFDTEPTYIYAVFTCGSKSMLCQESVQKLLGEKGFILNAAWEVCMPSNYVIMAEILTEEEEKPVLEAADMTLGQIVDEIWERSAHLIAITEEDRVMHDQMAPMYLEAIKTHKFWIDDTCVGCATCAGRCPVQAITMLDGYPSWNTGTCQHCMSCIRCGAVEYGVTTYGRKRYKHPDLRKKAGTGDHVHDHH